MKTSPTQFDLMITFMEQHGDLSKPVGNAKGRISTINKWEELASMLNSDGSGDSKPVEKWKKVWSDLKNNTKKKAAKIHKSATGTGGGPATHAKLNDVEGRVLAVIGMLAATGLKGVDEAGFSQEVTQLEKPATSPVPTYGSSQIELYNELWDQAGPSTQAHVAPPTSQMKEYNEILFFENDGTKDHTELNQTPPPLQSHVAPVLIHVQPDRSGQTPPRRVGLTPPRRVGLTPPRRVGLTPPRHVGLTPPRHVGLTPPRHDGLTSPRRVRPTRARRSPRRGVRPNTDQAAEHFLRSDEEWRLFKMEQHRDHVALKKEEYRLRALELESQGQWQAILSRAIDILDRVADKYCDK